MENIDFVIIIFSLLLLLCYILLKRKFIIVSIILYIILCLFISIQEYNNYQEAFFLFNRQGGIFSGDVPEILKGTYITFGLFMVYSFINIILISLFYKKQLKQNAIVKP
ncbi:MAG: hypothetical protein D8M51_11655 [Ignavibacteriae bacterium]|nr:hypothetical protein [Ignavibacteriota bacterium]